MRTTFWTLIYRLRTWHSFLRLHWLLFKHKWGLIALSIATAIFGLHTFFSQSHYWNADFLAVISILASMLLLRKDFFDLSRAFSGIHSLDFDLMEIRSRVEFHESYKESGYVIDNQPRGSARDRGMIPAGNVRYEIETLRNVYGGAFSFLMHLNLLFLQEYMDTLPGHGFTAMQ